MATELQNQNEKNDAYLSPCDSNEVGLESPDNYLKRVRADKEREKAKVANWVALILVSGLVLSLPFYVFTIWLVGAESTDVEEIFGKWYDVTAPLVGAVIGALFGLSIANRNSD
jgi:hypothetical protein